MLKPELLKSEMPTGSKLFVAEGLSPENAAMLQALYSRSASSVEEHFEKVMKSGSERFMDNYVVGYGHKSIADCGSTTLFIEGVSLLAAKAIQDWPLYSGQETSTRYIDMSKQPIVDPVGTRESKAILDLWMGFYVDHQEAVARTVRARYPRRVDEKEDVYERAVKARVFDVMRGFLPAGICTQLSWHTNLRQAGDHLLLLSKHPSQEVAGLGRGLGVLLAKAYPSSGFEENLAGVSGVGKAGGEEALKSRESWEEKVANAFTYPSVMKGSARSYKASWDAEEVRGYKNLYESRPRGCVLPHFLSDLGQATFAFELDFGSFRDLQRHRNGVCRMPLLTTDLGFHEWYLGELDLEVVAEAKKLVERQKKAILGISKDPVVRQYYTALGFKVLCNVTYALPAAVYVMELRSSKTVHPTLREVVHQMIRDFRADPAMHDLVLHVDMDPDGWDVRRGSQNIQAKS